MSCSPCTHTPRSAGRPAFRLTDVSEPARQTSLSNGEVASTCRRTCTDACRRTRPTVAMPHARWETKKTSSRTGHATIGFADSERQIRTSRPNWGTACYRLLQDSNADSTHVNRRPRQEMAASRALTFPCAWSGSSHTLRRPRIEGQRQEQPSKSAAHTEPSHLITSWQIAVLEPRRLRSSLRSFRRFLSEKRHLSCPEWSRNRRPWRPRCPAFP